VSICIEQICTTKTRAEATWALSRVDQRLEMGKDVVLLPNLFLFMHRLGEVDATRAAPALSFPLLIPAPAFHMSLQSLIFSLKVPCVIFYVFHNEIILERQH
jgi:hypothetical protein